MRLGDPGVPTVRRRPAHRVRGLLQLPRDLLQIPIARLPGQPLQLARGLLGLLGQIARRVAAAPLSALLRRGPASLPFQLLFLAAGQLAQLLQRLVDLLVAGLLLAALHGLVLVAQGVGLQLEEVGQILRGGPLLASASAPALLLLALQGDEALVGLLGLLQLPQSALLRRNRAARAERAQGVLRLRHRLDRDRQGLGDALEGLVGAGDPAVHDPLHQGLDLLAQSLLAVRDADDVLLPVLGSVAVAVADQVEAGRDDLPLQHRQILVHAAATAAATTTAAATAVLALAVVAAVGTDLQEVDVGESLPRRGGVVPRDPVVGDEVPDLESVLLQEEGVPGGDLGERLGARRVDVHGVGGPAVHAVDEEDLRYAQIVVGAGFDEDLLDRGHLDVAPRPAEGDGRPLVAEHVDPVVGGAGHPDPAQGGELHAVEAVLADGEGAEEGAVRPCLHRERVPRVHHEAGGGHGQRGGHRQLDPRPGERGHVAPVLEAARRHPRVAREVVDHLQPVDRGKVRDPERVGAGADAVGLDVVDGLLRDVEEEALVAAVAVLDHRQGRVAALALGAGVQHDVVGVEAVRDGAHHEVGVARDGGVAGLERDAVGVDRLRRADREEERVHAVAQEAGAERQEEDGREREAAEHTRRDPDRPLLDPLPVVDAPALARGLPDHLAEELRFLEPAVAGGLHGGHELRLERGLVLLQVERDPFVGHAPDEGPEHRPDHEEADHQPEDDPQRQDGLRLEAQRLQGGGGDEEGEECSGQRERQPPQQELQPPAATNPADDPQEFFLGPRVAPDGHLSPLPVTESVTSPTPAGPVARAGNIGGGSQIRQRPGRDRPSRGTPLTRPQPPPPFL